jgi:signal transduction histidine kinase
VIGDVTRIRQSLSNLLSNTAKIHGKGQILKVLRESGKIPTRGRFEVTDTGIGMSEEQDADFRPVHPGGHLDHPEMRTGLGTTISRNWSIMGGRIGVERRG